MTISSNSRPDGQEGTTSVRALLRRDGPGLLGISAATIAVVLGTYGIGLAGGAGPRGATLGALAAACVWIALTAGVFAARGDDWLGALLRGGITADASGVALLVLWLSSPSLTLLSAAKIYCTLLAMALLGVAAARVPRTSPSRYVAALLVAFVMTALLATPFWTGGLLKLSGEGIRETVVRWAVFANPFYCITAEIAERTGFVWHEAPLMYGYGLTRIGDYAAPPPPPWYAAAWRWAVAALILSLGRILLDRISRNRRLPGPRTREWAS